MAHATRVLLINAINTYAEVETRYPNLGLGYLAASVRKNLSDAPVEFKIIDRNIQQVIKEFKPDLAGITSVSQNFNIAQQYADYCGSHGIPVVMGGIHLTCIPESLPKSASAACLGESEWTFVDIMKAFLNNSLNPHTLNSIPGIAYWKDGKLIKTNPRAFESCLDNIPLPARDLLPIESHSYMFTSRGCPYLCSFCASSRFWNKVRFFSAEYVVNEIGVLVRDYKVKMISFFDDLFILHRQRMRDIVSLLEKRSLIGKVDFTCSCRANMVDDELAQILTRMGVVSVGIGFESGSDEILKYLKGKTVSVEHNKRAIDILKRNGIAVNGSFVIGSPGETKEQIMDTYNFIKNNNLDLFDIYLLTPYPGTPVWEYAKSRGIVSEPVFDWSRLNINTCQVSNKKIIILSEVLSKKQLLSLYRRFVYLRFWRNIQKVGHHPMRRDVPKMAWKKLKELLYLKKRI